MASGKAIDAGEPRKNHEPEAYGRALAASIQATLATRRTLKLDRSRVPELLKELDRFEPERRQIVVCNSKKFRSLALCEALLETSKEFWFSSAADARERAELAVAVVETLEPGTYDAGVVSDVRARAWAYLANAFKILTDYQAADRCFANAEEHLAQGTGNPTEEARILDLKIAFRIGQRRLQEAEQLADQVLRLYREIGDTHSQGRVLIRKGMSRGHAGDHEGAVRLLRQGLQLVKVDVEPRLDLIGRQNLALYLSDGGHHAEAKALIEALRPRFEEAEDHLCLVRLQWMEGRIALGQNELEEAEQYFLEVFEDFSEREMGYDAALVSLDLAQVYAAQGRNRELRELALRLAPIFRSREVHREALAALLMFQQSAEEEAVTRTLLRKISTFLERVRSGPAGTAERESLTARQGNRELLYDD